MVYVVLYYWKKAGAESRSGKLSALSDERCMVYSSDVVTVVLYYWKKAGAESHSGKLSALTDERCMVYSSDMMTVVQTDSMLWTLGAAGYQTAKKMIQVFSVR